jgi:hypothetical protein
MSRDAKGLGRRDRGRPRRQNSEQALPCGAGTESRCVVTHFHGSVPDHQRATVTSIARAVAALIGADFGGQHDPGSPRRARPYFVPNATLLAAEARGLGIETADDLFGGVVPFPFVATKSIVHPLVAPDAFRPPGWSSALPERVRDVVLPGFTAFAPADARRAARELLAVGAVRLKAGQGVGGHGQAVVADAAALDEAIAIFDREGLRECGIAVELDLQAGITHSVGQVKVGGLQASYCGVQSTTTDNAGARVFGGSDLVIARGGYEALVALPLDPGVRIAIDQARAFDAAANAAFPGLLASRRNYDVLCGRDRAGRVRSGVLEQSWRLGGASGPEIAALAAFRADPALRVVHAAAVERFGTTRTPDGAIVQFSGVDSRLGALVKYTVIDSYRPDEPAR